MNQQDPGGREWRPYEIATPIVREGVAVLDSPSVHTPYTPPRAAVADATHDGAVALASRLSRLLAQLIDSALMLVPIALIFFGAYRQYRMSSLGMQGLSTGATSALVLALAIAAAIGIWHIVLLVQHGQTIGKRFIGIRIARPDGSQASFLRILLLRSLLVGAVGGVLRWMHPLLGAAFSLGGILMIFGESRRCLHDRIADTIVVDA